MSVLETVLSAPWLYYSNRARETHLGRADHFNLGEEQLWETLRVIESGEPFDADCRNRLDRIPQNRAKKYLRLLQKLALFARPATSIEPPFLDVKDEVEAVERHLSPAEQEVERRLAADETYAQISADMRITAAALKVRVSRWRRRVREHLGEAAGDAA